MAKQHESPVVYPGSFDPFTLGHLDILERVLRLFPRVMILVAEDGKAGLLAAEMRAALIRSAVAGMDGVEVRVFTGLLVDAVAELGAQAVVRGIRCPGDYEHEWGLAGVNSLLAQNVEFVYFLARPELAAVSSTLVRDVLKHGGPVDKLLPPEIAVELQKMFPRR